MISLGEGDGGFIRGLMRERRELLRRSVDAVDAAGVAGAEASCRSPPPPLPRATQEPKAPAPLVLPPFMATLICLPEKKLAR